MSIRKSKNLYKKIYRMEKGKVNMTALKKKSETCDQQLRRWCKNIADDISNPKISKDDGGEAIELQTAHEWMEGVYDIEWITYQDGRYKAARLLVAGGGPTIWVNMHTHEVEGYWWGDRVIEPFVDNLQLDEYLEELHANK